ncbi:hypothetical protein L6V77_00265 [Myxococcota bacterium]|nr:hypothetical protein [Myxococcota bacterium]
MKRRLLRFAAVGVVAAAAGSLLRAHEAGARAIDVHYAGAPDGALDVTFRDDGGRFLHRTGFNPGVFRAHTISLPPGGLRVELRSGTHSRTVDAYIAADTRSLEVVWPVGPAPQGP